MFQSRRLPEAMPLTYSVLFFMYPPSETFLQMFCKCFILHVTTSYLQHVFSMLKHLQKCFATFAKFCKCFSVKHLQNILGVVTCKIKH